MRGRRHNDDGFFSNRGVGVAVTTIAIIATGFGVAGTGKGGAPTTSPTTTVATTTTVPGTTTTGSATTTTTVAPTGCAAPGIASNAFPCSTSSGYLGSPALLTAYTGPSTITSCGVVLDHKLFTGNIDINVRNGNATNYTTEAAARAGACVVITNSVFTESSCGQNCPAIEMHYPTYGCPNGPTGQGCGPLYLADTTFNLFPPNLQGVSAAVSKFNMHIWRIYVHGGTLGVQCDGFCDVHDSTLLADHGDTGGNTSHMDGFISNGNDSRQVNLIHNTMSCGSTVNATDCSAPIGLFSDTCCSSTGINVVVVDNNYFVNVNSASFVCNSYAAKTFTNSFTFVEMTNNVYDSNCTAGIVLNWYASHVGNKWCNNRMTDGSRVHSAQFPPPTIDAC